MNLHNDTFLKISDLEIRAKEVEGRRKDMTWREHGSNREHAVCNSTPYKKKGERDHYNKKKR